MTETPFFPIHLLKLNGRQPDFQADAQRARLELEAPITAEQWRGSSLVRVGLSEGNRPSAKRLRAQGLTALLLPLFSPGLFTSSLMFVAYHSPSLCTSSPARLSLSVSLSVPRPFIFCWLSVSGDVPLFFYSLYHSIALGLSFQPVSREAANEMLAGFGFLLRSCH